MTFQIQFIYLEHSYPPNNPQFELILCDMYFLGENTCKEVLRSAPSPTQWPSLVENKDKMAGESSGHIIYGGLSKVVVTPNDHLITSNDMINCTFDLGVNLQ